jgi:hypothetical protein
MIFFSGTMIGLSLDEFASVSTTLIAASTASRIWAVQRME